LLSLLEMKHDLTPAFSGVPQNSVQYVHLLAEIEKRVFADRAQYLGDPAIYPGPVKELLDPKYLAGRAALVNVEHPTPTQDVKPGLTDHHNTTQFSIIDRWGNAVPGGSRIATSIFQVLTNWHDFHMPLRDAVAVPRIHHQLLPPDTVFEEPFAGLDPGTKKALIQRGYKFATQGWNGDIQVIAIGTDGTAAVSDPRGRGVARVLN
jgi:gamma-glutamyltranspeptidase